MLGSIEKKLLSIFIISTALVLGMVSAVSLITERYDTRTVAQNQNRELAEVAMRLLRSELKKLDVLAKDYARWDETYDYVQYKNDYFTQSNLNLDALNDLGVDGASILNVTMDILYNEGLFKTGEGSLIERHLDNLSPELRTISQSGAILHNNQIVLFSSVPIQDSFKISPANGRLVLFKRVGLAMMDEITTTINQSFSLNTVTDGVEYLFLSNTDSWALINTDIQSENNKIVGQYQLSHSTKGVLPIDIILESTFEPRTFQHSMMRLFPYIVALLILPLIMITLLRRIITSPTRELIKWLNQVDGSQLAEELKPFKHADKGEIGELSQQFSSIYNNLYQQHQFSQILLYSISDFIFTVDHHGNIDYCNPAATEWLNISANQLYGQSFEFLIANLSEDTPSPSNWLYRAIHSASEYSGISLIRKFGEETLSEWMEIQVSPMIKSDDEPIGALVILRPKPDYSA